MNPGDLRSAALRLSVGDRLRLIWDLVRSLLGWDGAIEPAAPAEPTLEQAIARIEQLIDQALAAHPDWDPGLKRPVLNRAASSLSQSPDRWRAILATPEETLLKRVSLWLVMETFSQIAAEESDTEKAELVAIIEGK
ncbi:hypothetical protein [Limnothrix redekei]|uniref:Uncharacterized protein n=1 Tax=Limnothrix redekei LRLZ20PSL1 TaxID=3112953 RepID=A0ABW7CB57_9CYAN